MSFLDDLDARQGEMHDTMTELRETIAVSRTLASEVSGTVDAIDRLVARFEVHPGSAREPLRLVDIRGAAIETGKAAERTTKVLELSREFVESNALDKRIDGLTDPLTAVVDRAFWRGLVLVCLLIAGLGGVRLLPGKSR